MAKSTYTLSMSNSWNSGTYEIKNDSAGNVTVTVKLWRNDGGRSYNLDASNNFYITIAGNTKRFTVTSVSSTVTLTHTVKVSVGANGSGSASVTVGGSVPETTFAITGNNSKTFSFSDAAKATYAVEYDANGGSGAPATQTKTYGTNLTLSSTVPTRTGYTFQGWGTSASDTSVDYAAGATYSSNAEITLYAIWKANTYAVTYYANGGTGAPSAQTKIYGTNLTLSSTIPTRQNYNFLGWGISASATTVSYPSGATYSTNAPIKLYAIWELAYVVPTVTSLVVTRCNASGTADDYGTYAKVEFDWETCQLTGTNNVKSIKIEWKTLSASSYGNSTTVSASGTRGSVSRVIGNGALNVDTIYTVRVTVTDNKNGSYQPIANIPLAKFIMDVLAGGNGVSFGKPADLANTFDVDFLAKFRKNATFDALLTALGIETDDLTVDDLTVLNQLILQSTLHPQMDIVNGGSTATMYRARKSNASASIRFGVAADGLRHGIYSDTHGRWLVQSNENDETIVSGDSLELNASVGIKSNRPLKQLWTGAYFMNANQSIMMSEKTSEQLNGIVLSFCIYNSGAAGNYGWHSYFVPKELVKQQNGKGFVFSGLMNGNGNYPAVKYLYISDQTITGYANNEGTKTTSSGFSSLYNSSWVLKYVFGV